MKDGLLISRLTRAIWRSTLKLTPLAWLLAAATAHANDIAVTDAWTPPNAEIGSDAVLGMVVTNDGRRSRCARSCFVSRCELFREAPNRYWRRGQVGASGPRHSNRREIKSNLERRGAPRRAVADSAKAGAGRGIPVLRFVPPSRSYSSPGASAAKGSGLLKETRHRLRRRGKRTTSRPSNRGTRLTIPSSQDGLSLMAPQAHLRPLAQGHSRCHVGELGERPPS